MYVYHYRTYRTYNVKRLLLFTNALCLKSRPFKTRTLRAEHFLGALKLLVKNLEDCDGEVKVLDK